MRSSPFLVGRVAFAACLGVLVGFGSLLVYTFGVFVRPLSAQFGLSRDGISRGFGFAALSVAFCSPTLGRWLDRYGPRRVILPCMTVFGCGIASLAVLRSHLWQFYATCILLGAVGNGATHLSYARAISTWFHRCLGMAMAFVMVGAGLGAMILPLVAQESGGRAAGSGWTGPSLRTTRSLKCRPLLIHGFKKETHHAAGDRPRAPVHIALDASYTDI